MKPSRQQVRGATPGQQIGQSEELALASLDTGQRWGYQSRATALARQVGALLRGLPAHRLRPAPAPRRRPGDLLARQAGGPARTWLLDDGQHLERQPRATAPAGQRLPLPDGLGLPGVPAAGRQPDQLTRTPRPDRTPIARPGRLRLASRRNSWRRYSMPAACEHAHSQTRCSPGLARVCGLFFDPSRASKAEHLEHLGTRRNRIGVPAGAAI